MGLPAFKQSFKNYGKRKVKKAERKQHDWSILQKMVFDNIANGTGDTVIVASPGSGKSATILEGLWHVPPEFRGSESRTLSIAFNTTVAQHLNTYAPPGVDCLTFHRLGYQVVRREWGSVYGIGKWGTVDKDDQIAEALAIQEVGDSYERTRLRKNLMMAMKLAKNTLAVSHEEVDNVAANFGINTCGLSTDDFTSHVVSMMEKTRDKPLILNGQSVISFDDMIWLPYVNGWQPKKYDYVFVDEAQDMSPARFELVKSALSDDGRLFAVGDPYQCVAEGTLISTHNGQVPVEKLSVGDKVLSWRNNKIAEQTIDAVNVSEWTRGFKITTESGKELIASPNHKIWISGFELKDNQHIVYMMYRTGFGFRVGITSKYKNGASPFGQRAASEGAEKLWVLKICESREDALYYETCYSLAYSIPTLVFRGEERGLNQDRIQDVFDTFGMNGANLLADQGMHFDFPHWTAQGASIGSDRTPSRLSINIAAHGSKTTLVRCEWSEDYFPIKEKLESIGAVVTSSKKARRVCHRLMVRQHFSNYRDAVIFANKIKNSVSGAYIREGLHTPKGYMQLVTASGVFPGMSVAVRDGDSIKMEKVVSVEEVEDLRFIDIGVDDASNFFGGEILSHNCIYSFAGAIPSLITNLEKESARLPLSISYRLPKNVVKLAKTINPEIQHADNAIEGKVYGLERSQVIGDITPGSAILSRANYPLVETAFSLLKQGIKANIVGKDIGNRFLWRISCWEPDTIEDLENSVNDWHDEVCEHLNGKRSSTQRIEDEAKSILGFADGADSVSEVKERIESFFSDEKSNTVQLSTAHKAKGLEWDRVYLLDKTFKPEKGGEDERIYYVAITRPKKRLVFIND